MAQEDALSLSTLCFEEVVYLLLWGDLCCKNVNMYQTIYLQLCSCMLTCHFPLDPCKLGMLVLLIFVSNQISNKLKSASRTDGILRLVRLYFSFWPLSWILNILFYQSAISSREMIHWQNGRPHY
jgi:hypothetical protein